MGKIFCLIDDALGLEMKSAIQRYPKSIDIFKEHRISINRRVKAFIEAKRVFLRWRFCDIWKGIYSFYEQYSRAFSGKG
jgi:hypothetical protein